MKNPFYYHMLVPEVNVLIPNAYLFSSSKSGTESYSQLISNEDEKYEISNLENNKTKPIKMS
jgi:hypothetical protein